MLKTLAKPILAAVQHLSQGSEAENAQSSPSLTESLELETLRLGDSGERVRQLQSVLAELSLYHHSIDGYFGPSTEQTMRRVQQHFGLPETGCFDAASWYALSFWSEDLRELPQKVSKPKSRISTRADNYGLA
ncbi:MAG: peptidoglycan-binding domain-containing protein [Prochlorothrix sp.]|nr:peptidoglycan-binding domain-containing protein [Prochlorothrix sp.]